MVKKFSKTNYLFSPEHRFFHYFFYTDYVFGVAELKIIKNLNLISDKSCEIILDQNYLNDFLSFNFKNYDKEINIILFNDGIDFDIHKVNLNKLKLKFKKTNIFSLSNFYSNEDNIISLNNFKITEKGSLKRIDGINFIKKIKYFYPIFYSIYNFIRYFYYSNHLINKKKIIFVGKADEGSVIKILEKHFSHNKKLLNYFSENFNKIYHINNLDLFFDLFNQPDFKILKFHKKYHLVNLVVRCILITHLKKFKHFYHKKNTRLPLDLLHSNIYKKTLMLDLGIKVGNSDIYSRSLFINRFYKNSSLKINFFFNDINYSSQEIFEKRIKTIKKSLDYFFNYKEFNCSFEELKNKFLQINSLLNE